MVCATSNNNMNQQQQQQQQRNYKEDDDDFDMAMEEDDDSEEESSQDGDTSSPPSSTTSTPKRPVTQALFLNFTSDLSPQKMNKKKSKPKKQTAYRVNGVNILNRNNLDSKTAIERIQRRRENHNHVERRRRDNINNTIFELSSVVPNAIQPGQKPNKGNILKLSLDYIRDLQAENNALKERLSQYTSSRPTSISPPLTASTITTPITHTPPIPPMNTNNTAATSVLKSVDETTFSNNNSAPNSPTRYVRYHPSSMSVPSSPHHSNMQKDSVPPPLVLPPPRQPIQQQQHLQTVFSTMSVSSNTSSTTSTPTLSSAPSFYNNNPQQIYIPQPPQLYNHHHEVFQHHQKQQGLRPLLPATKSQPIIQQQPQQQILPALRMSGYEKIYGNVCRY